MRIVLTCRWPDAVENQLQERHTVLLPEWPLDSADAIIDQCRRFSADVLASTSGNHLSAEDVFRLPESLKLIANFGAGVDNIDIEAAASRGIVVSNTPDAVTACTADLTVGLIIATCRRFYEAETIIRDNRWQGLSLTDYFGTDVTGKTLGIVGLGRIGRAVAARARSFEMDMLYFSRHRYPKVEERYGLSFTENLADLLSRSDIVTLHCTLTESTRHLIDRSTIQMMKPGAVLINTARGSIVEESALADALVDGHLSAAGLDVYEFEPAVTEKLRELPQATLLPHIGTATRECRLEMGMRAARNIETFAMTGCAADSVT